MLESLSRNWWAIAIRGAAAILFGLLAWVVPGLTLLWLVILFGAYALVDGVFNVIASFREPGHHWALLLEGLLGIGIGCMTFIWPGITAIVLLYLISFWAIVTGILEITAGIRLRRVIAHEWLMALMGIASVLFGVFVLFAPAAAGLAIALWIGAYAFIFGILMLVFAFRLRGSRRRIVGGTPIPRAI